MGSGETGRITHGRRRGFAGWFLFSLCLLSVAGACAADEPDRVLVAGPYLELHTGPGRGYPIFYIAERGEWVEILKRHTDWFKVRTARDKEGWVSRVQMETTLTEAGAQRTFRDVLFDDYLQRRIEFGFSVGQFENDRILTAYAGYRLSENFLLELAIGESAGKFSSTSLIYGALVSQPFPESRVSPFLALGAGRFKNTPKSTLVSAVETETDLANVGLGVRFYVTRQFFLRAEYRDHVALIGHNRTEAYQEWSLGISFFF